MNTYANVFSNILSTMLNENRPPNSQQMVRLMNQYINTQNDFNSNMTRMIQLLDRQTVTFDAAPIIASLFDLSANSPRLTVEQIEASTTSFNYELEIDQITCPITLEPIVANELVIKINRCGHIFKKNALLRWLERDSRCPVCRCELQN